MSVKENLISAHLTRHPISGKSGLYLMTDQTEPHYGVMEIACGAVWALLVLMAVQSHTFSTPYLEHLISYQGGVCE